MALTTEVIQVPETPSQPRGRPARPMLGWVAVGAAVLTTGVLAVAVLTPDGEPTDRILHYDVGDAKDHTNYNPVEATNTSPTGNGDAKDHTNYNPVEATNTSPTGNGDAKDHTNYNPVEATNTSPTGNGDAKDHTNYNPVEATNTSPTGNGDAKDHTNYNPVETDPV